MPRYAAVDVGSNSIRLEVAEVAPGSSTSILASDRQVTRLGESVYANGRISEDAMDLACRVLKRMAQTYRRLEVVGVRAVATSATRDAGNQREFLERASQVLGAPLEVISGQEEARLIHLGVQARWPHPQRNVLILDVGGGSAEIILSENGRLLEASSRPVGAVRLTEAFMKNDPPTSLELHRLEEFIDQKITPILRRAGTRKWHRVIGTAATAAAVVCAVNRVPRSKRDSTDRLRATTAQVRKLYREVSRSSLAARRKIPGIGPRRAEIIIPGVCLLLRVLQSCSLPSIYYSAAGLRDGIVADLAARGVGRELTRLTTEQRRTVMQMVRRYGVPVKHVRKVVEMAHGLFESLQPLHQLPPHYGRLLKAAAYLHDIGHYVSDTRHHKHSYYLVANSDMPGFTDHERLLVANLCRYHRKAMPNAVHRNFQPLNSEERRAVLFLAPLLRLADNLDRSHDQRVEALECQVRELDVLLRLRSAVDTDLEIWAGEQVAELFRRLYQRPVTLVRAQG